MPTGTSQTEEEQSQRTSYTWICFGCRHFSPDTCFLALPLVLQRENMVQNDILEKSIIFSYIFKREPQFSLLSYCWHLQACIRLPLLPLIPEDTIVFSGKWKQTKHNDHHKKTPDPLTGLDSSCPFQEMLEDSHCKDQREVFWAKTRKNKELRSLLCVTSDGLLKLPITWYPCLLL